MDLDILQQKLLAAARHDPNPQSVPEAFAGRVLARLDKPGPVDLALVWTRVLWRAAAVCAAVSILASCWSFLTLDGTIVTLETAVLSAVDELSINW